MIKPQIICSDGKNIDISLNIFNKIKNNNNNNHNNYLIDLSNKYYSDSEAIEKIINYKNKNFDESFKQFYEKKMKEIYQEKKILTEQLNILNEEKSFLNENLIDNIGNPIGVLIQDELSRIIIKQEKINEEIRKLNQIEIFLKGEFTFNNFFDFKKLNTRQTCNILCCADVLGIDEIINNYLKYNKINNLLIGMIEYYNKDLFNKISNILGYV